jgi:phosphoserine phosphatase RsbU/P
MPLIDESIPVTLEGVRRARAVLEAGLTRAGLDGTIRNNFLLAVSEIMTNLVRHALPRPDTIIVRLDHRRDELIVEILDDGTPFADFEGRMATAGTIGGPVEGGMGLSLVLRMFPEAAYLPKGSRRDGLNVFRLTSSIEGGVADLPKVLLVDDDPVLLRIYCLFLADDYRVETANSMVDAVRVLDRMPVDLVVSDIVMPGGSGIDLCARVRKDPSVDTLPFIFLSARRDVATLNAAEGLVIDDYLFKPVTKDLLLRSIGRSLRRVRFIRRRLGERLDDAITESLSPALPARLGPWRSAVRWQSADAGGGDLLFHCERPDGHLVVLADLMGHGEQAKFFSHALMGYLHGVLAGAGRDMRPAALLAKLSEIFARDRLLARTIATVLAVAIDNDGRVRLASAGHPAPILFDGKTVEPVDVGGTLPGLFPEVGYEEKTLHMSPGGRLVLFTDGLVETAASPGERQRRRSDLLAAISGGREASPEDIARRLVNAIGKGRDGTLEDDVTVAVLDYAP